MRRPVARSILITLIATAALVQLGCGGSGGNLTITGNQATQVVLDASFDSGVYRLEDPDTLTAVLWEGPMNSPRQVVTVRMFWNPQAGRTPLDPNATNVTVHHVIFSGDAGRQVGVYAGAGFLLPRSWPGDASFTGIVRHASLQLSDRSDAFADLLGQADMEGQFTAVRDDAAVGQRLHQLNTLLLQRLGYPRLIGR